MTSTWLGAGFALGIVAGFGTAVTAECLNGSALDRGVAVQLADGRVMAVSRREGALLQMNFTGPEDGRLRPAGRDLRHAWHGVFVSLLDRVGDDGAAVRIETPFVDIPPVPVAGAKGKLAWIDGKVMFTLPYAVGEAITLQLGDCSYQALPVTMDQPVKKGWRVEVEAWYLPDLGFGVPLRLSEVARMEPLP
jgi:hypothetical protein